MILVLAPMANVSKSQMKSSLDVPPIALTSVARTLIARSRTENAKPDAEACPQTQPALPTPSAW
jgi:hypothetical protein